jgi:hypothetical protein
MLLCRIYLRENKLIGFCLRSCRYILTILSFILIWKKQCDQLILHTLQTGSVRLNAVCLSENAID